VWIGLAGYDRPNIANRVDSFFSELFHLPIGKQLRLSSDIELLVGPVAYQNHVDSVVVLVAGTGSIAMSYEREGDGFRRTGRAGGWGHLLGDDGSGYSIGRQGLRVALEATDSLNLSQSSKMPGRAVDPLVNRIYEHFGVPRRGEYSVDLLSEILSPKTSGKQQILSSTRRIAEVARVVLDAAPSSKTAKGILEAGTKSLVHILTSLTEHRDIRTLDSSLILAGGIFQNGGFQEIFLKNLASSRISFGFIQSISDPALAVAQYLQICKA
jgi:N-acetylmuramic acid 6-phosphate etherase